MQHRFLSVAIVLFCFFGSAFSVAAQQPISPSPSPTPLAKVSPTPSLERRFVKNIAHDQVAIWTSPFKLHGDDVKWLLPAAVGTAALIATDQYTSSWIRRGGDLPVVSHDVSWVGKAYVTGGVAGAFYLAGLATHNYRARETGLLAGEALIDTGIVTEVLKLATQRPRPNSGNGHGVFFTRGNSFPSGHSSTVWSVATVIAYEYQKHPLVRYGAYAAAVGVSISRYSGRNHFLSDIVVGSAIGFGIGRYVYRTPSYRCFRRRPGSRRTQNDDNEDNSLL
jgi:membrane-associated phospholipid phosphatase